MDKRNLLEIASALDLGSIDEEKARTLLLGLLGVSKRFYKVYYNTFADEVLECLIEAVDESNAKYLFYKQGKWTENAKIERVVNVC